MKGSVLMGGIIGVALATGAGLWYSLQFAYYTEVSGLDQVAVGGEPWPVSNYRGIDGDSSPLKLRACFTVDREYDPVGTQNDEATPLGAPFWFDCFDAEQITLDLKAGVATAIVAEENEPFGFTSYIARYPDGRAYMWRQINDCGAAAFDGEPQPEGCANAADAGS